MDDDARFIRCLLACLVSERKGFIEGGGGEEEEEDIWLLRGKGRDLLTTFMFLARYLWFLI